MLLRGLDPERTFLHCRSLRTITAYKIPLKSFPQQWKQYAINGFLKDADRNVNYPPEIAADYNAELSQMRSQLIARTSFDADPAIFRYLIEHDMIRSDEIDELTANAKGQPETLASLLSHKKRLQSEDSGGDFFSLLDI